MEIKRNDIGAQSAEITITVTPSDYEEKVNEGIRKVQRQASMPGFRPGKIPTGLIKKQYGTQILVDELNKLLDDAVQKYISENKIEILGNPLPKQTESPDFNNQKDFTFTYELGLAPEFKVDLNTSNKFTYKTVRIDDELVDKYIADVRRNYGTPAHPDTVGEKDVVFADLNELDENGAIRPGGIFKSTSISLDRHKNEDARAKLLGLRKDEKAIVNINALYPSDTDKSVSLGIDKETAEGAHCDLQVTVKNISRMEEAELNQDLFDRLYGPGKIESEEAFREKIREEIAAMFRADAEKFLRNEVENKLVEKVDPQLPDEFLKRWLMAVNEKPITREELESDYPNYAKAMKWRLIENRIIRENEIQVKPEEVKEEAKAYIRSEYARYGQQATDEDLEKISKDLLNREKEAQKIFENLYTRKVMELVREKCTLETKEVSYDEFFRN